MILKIDGFPGFFGHMWNKDFRVFAKRKGSKEPFVARSAHTALGARKLSKQLKLNCFS